MKEILVLGNAVALTLGYTDAGCEGGKSSFLRSMFKPPQ